MPCNALHVSYHTGLLIIYVLKAFLIVLNFKSYPPGLDEEFKKWVNAKLASFLRHTKIPFEGINPFRSYHLG